MTITAAADGSALGNPGPAGWAWYVDEDRWDAGGWPHATNNQGELRAVLELLHATAHLDEDLLILCDSQYVINSVTKWMPGWKKKCWKKSDGKPVLNRELLEQLDEALSGRRYRFEWVKGHAGHPLNEAADSKARAVSEAYSRGAVIPEGPGWPGAPVAETSGTRSPAAAEKTTAAASTSAAPERIITPSLFDFEEEPVVQHSLTVELDEAEYARLRSFAARRGVSLSEALRSLVP